MPTQARDVHDQIGSCSGLIVPGHLLELMRSGVLFWLALRMVPNISEVFEDRQPIWVLPAVRYATSWIALSCESGHLLPLFWAAQQSVTMVSHHDLCASFSRGSRQHLL